MRCIITIIKYNKNLIQKGQTNMTFFDDIKRTATDAADKAVKKTNQLAAIAKLNFNIKSSEAKLSAIYEEIGRLFYTAERSGNDHTEEITVYIMKADNVNSDIASYKAELAKAKKVTICDGCGNEISNDAAFCSYCGKKLEKCAEPDAEEDTEAEECKCDSSSEENADDHCTNDAHVDCCCTKDKSCDSNEDNK